MLVSITTAAYNQAWGSQQVYTNLLALSLVSLAGITMSSAAQTRRQNELDQVRRIAEAAQTVPLRPVPARLGPIRAASVYRAAETGAQIGGDLYEAAQTPGELGHATLGIYYARPWTTTPGGRRRNRRRPRGSVRSRAVSHAVVSAWGTS
ncbi:hypothetical protein [Streptomyces noursei]|uniref:hypothetical protein n=1 Tax=Streptomyces noursei TaxID=1971 RepID=UPI0030B85FE8